MRIDFKRIPYKWTHMFEASIGYSNYKAYVKRLFIPYPRVIHVEDNGDTVFRMEEKTMGSRYLYGFLNVIPFVSLFTKKKSKYAIMEHDIVVGSIECLITSSEYKYIIDYKSSNYTVYNTVYKKRLRYYIFKDHYQVGAIEKHRVGTDGVNPYYGTINEDVPKTVVLAFLHHLHVRELNDFALSYGESAKSYTVYGGTFRNRHLDVEFDHIALSDKKENSE